MTVTGANCPAGEFSASISKPWREEMSSGNDFNRLKENFIDMTLKKPISITMSRVPAMIAVCFFTSLPTLDQKHVFDLFSLYTSVLYIHDSCFSLGAIRP